MDQFFPTVRASDGMEWGRVRQGGFVASGVDEKEKAHG
jgi:hypothetical protein